MINKRSVRINGRLTTVTIEDVFWTGARKLAVSRRTTLSDLLNTIDRRRPDDASLSSAIRAEVLTHFMSAAEATGRAA